MEDYIPGQIYMNLVKLMEYRNVKITSNQLSMNEIIQKLNHFEMITISGTRDKTDIRGQADVIVILIAPGSKYSNKSGDFKKLLRGFEKTQNNVQRTELFIVSEVDLTVHIKKYLNNYKHEASNMYIESYNYSLFKIEVPMHVLVPKHVIASDAEVEEFCNQHYTSKDKLPKILQSDPVAVWYGLRPNMVVKVIRPSETAGTAVMYRVCIKN